MIAIAGPFFFIVVIMLGAGIFLSGFFARQLVMSDEPNERSSHDAPTARAGGIAIFGVFFLGLTLTIMFGQSSAFGHLNRLNESHSGFTSFACLIVAAVLVGLFDDIYGLKPRLKFVGQLFIAVLFVSMIGSVNSVPLPFFGMTNIGVLGFPLTIFWIVAFMNAYNFMDGANGLAACVAIFVLLVISMLAGAVGASGVTLLAFLLAVAICAFLPQNMLLRAPFSKGIFMGDSGSQGISFMIAGLAVFPGKWGDSAIAGEIVQPTVSILLVPVLMLPFITDVTFTLFDRYKRKQNLLLAHREHIYQLLMRMDLSHGEVSALYLGGSAISAIAALIMLSMPPSWQWIIPVLLITAFWRVAMSVSHKGKERNLLKSGVDETLLKV